MATSASLVVRISADLNDFNRQFDVMTKGVEKAAKKIESLGEAMTLGITLPVAAAAAKLFELGADTEDVAGRMGRVFGSAADAMDASIKQMMKSVPETKTALEGMAISVDNLMQGMGFAPPVAATMSGALLKLAGDAAAFAHVPMTDALEALEKGLAGKTRGLLQFGIAINQADIKQKAFEMGILHTGHDLTEAGTATAAYALIMEKSSRVTGEAGRTADDAGKQWAFFKQGVAELGDQIGTVLLPVMGDLVKGAREVVGVIAEMPPGFIKFAAGIAATAAVVGPAIFGIVKITKSIAELRAAILLLQTGGSLIGFFAAALTPIGWIVAGIAAVTLAVGALMVALHKLKGEQDFSGAPTTRTIGPVTFRQIGQGDAGARMAAGPATERLSGTPLDQFKRAADEITKGFDAAVAHGRPIESLLGRINSLHAEAARLLRAQGGAFNQDAEAAQAVLDKLTLIRNAIALANAATDEQRRNIVTRIAREQQAGFNAPQQAATDVAKETFDKSREMELRFAKVQLPQLTDDKAFVHFEAFVTFMENEKGSEHALRLREALAELTPTFDAARVASVEFKEAQRAYANDLAKRLELSQKPSTFQAGKEAQVQSNELVKSTADSYALREALLKLPDGFNAARAAAVEFGETQRQYAEDLQKRLLLSERPSTFNAGTEATIRSNESVKGFADDIALREALLKLPDGFNAAKLAAVELGEQARTASESVQLAFAKLISPLGSFGQHLTGLSIGMQQTVLNLATAVGMFADQIASRIGGGGPSAAFGGAIGGLLGPGLLLAAMPWAVMLTPLGAAVGTIGGNIAGRLIGGMFDKPQNAADAAAASLNDLSTAANKVAASISNLPQFFKVELERFRAAPLTQPPAPETPPPPPITNPTFGGGATPKPSGDVVPSHVFNIQTLNVTSSATSVKDLMADVYQEAAKSKATGSRAPFVFAPQAAFAG